MNKDACVVVLDTTETVLKMVKAVLGQARYRVACFSDIKESFVYIEEEQPDLLLIDQKIISANLELFQRVSQKKKWPVVPAVVMSFVKEDIDVYKTNAFSLVDYLEKPFSPGALVTVISHAIQGVKQERRPHISPLMNPLQTGSHEKEKLQDIFVTQLLQSCKPEQKVIVQQVAEQAVDFEFIESLQWEFLKTPAAPALCGNLRSVPFAEVLQLLALQRQSGVIQIAHGDALVDIYLHDGMIDFVQASQVGREFLLGRVLVNEGFIDQSDLEVFLENRQGAARLLGEQLIMLGYVTEEQLVEALRIQSSQLVYELIRWQAGTFRFSPFATYHQSQHSIALHINHEELLMEGYRRVDEWKLMKTAIGDFNVKPSPNMDIGLQKIEDNISEDELEVLQYVDGNNSIAAIIQLCGKSSFDALQIIYRLMSGNYIHIA